MKNLLLSLLLFNLTPNLLAKELSDKEQQYHVYAKQINIIEDDVLDQGLSFYIPKELQKKKSDQQLVELGEKLKKSYQKSITNLAKLSSDLKKVAKEIEYSKVLSSEQVDTLSLAHVNGTHLLLEAFEREVKTNYKKYTQMLSRKLPLNEFYHKLSSFSQGNQCQIRNVNMGPDSISFSIDGHEQLVTLTEENIIVNKPIWNQIDNQRLKLSAMFNEKTNQFIFAQDNMGNIQQVIVKDARTGNKKSIECPKKKALLRLQRQPASIE